MSIHVYGMNHVALEVTDIDLAIKFYTEVFGMTVRKRNDGNGPSFLNLGDAQFIALFKVDKREPDNARHFGIVVKDDDEIAEVRKKVEEWGLELNPKFACDFRDPFGNRIQVVDLSVAPGFG